jgi:uncharacterized membrane protein (DUF485 family)
MNTLHNNHEQKKSLIKRFLFIISISVFLAYLVLGIVIIFWRFITDKAFPFAIAPSYQLAFGLLIIAYAFLRLFRFLKSNKENA